MVKFAVTGIRLTATEIELELSEPFNAQNTLNCGTKVKLGFKNDDPQYSAASQISLGSVFTLSLTPQPQA